MCRTQIRVDCSKCGMSLFGVLYFGKCNPSFRTEAVEGQCPGFSSSLVSLQVGDVCQKKSKGDVGNEWVCVDKK